MAPDIKVVLFVPDPRKLKLTPVFEEMEVVIVQVPGWIRIVSPSFTFAKAVAIDVGSQEMVLVTANTGAAITIVTMTRTSSRKDFPIKSFNRKI